MRTLTLQKYTSIMLAAALLSTPVLAATNAMANSPATTNNSFQAYDRDANGLVSPTELRERFLGNIPDDVFQSFDRNRDGNLNTAEFSKFMERNYEVSLGNQQELLETKHQNEMAKKQAAEKAAQLQQQTAEELENVSEFNQAPKVKFTMDFIVFDQNQDKLVDIKEFRERTNSIIDPEAVYGAYDENKDGKLNIQEFQKYVDSDPKVPVSLSSK